MKNFAVGLVCTLLLVSLAAGADAPPVNDGNGHGDPPFLQESGWRPLLNGKNLDGWTYRTPERKGWVATRAVVWGGVAKPGVLAAIPAPGDRIVNSAATLKMASDILTVEKFGDVELYIEFMCAENSNSGVYMNGQYEVQLWDSYGKNLDDHFSNYTGAIYNYEPGTAAAKEAEARSKPTPGGWVPFGGVAPMVHAERPAGQWQSLQIWFQPPRFDASGKKTANAKFLRVLLNGVLIQENVERVAFTQAAPPLPESATGPILLQGDHGAIAFRNIYVRPLRPLPQK
jgi:hypothetical protein